MLGPPVADVNDAWTTPVLCTLMDTAALSRVPPTQPTDVAGRGSTDVCETGGCGAGGFLFGRFSVPGLEAVLPSDLYINNTVRGEVYNIYIYRNKKIKGGHVRRLQNLKRF